MCIRDRSFTGPCCSFRGVIPVMRAMSSCTSAFPLRAAVAFGPGLLSLSVTGQDRPVGGPRACCVLSAVC
eukprot:3286747-Rhodomonas_salina.3